MYQVTLFFDQKTETILQNYINTVAEASGNWFMVENKVPPHMTIAAFDAPNDEIAKKVWEKMKTFQEGEVQLVSIGGFLPYVLNIQVVYNSYLHALSSAISEIMTGEVLSSKYYQPFQWMPHVTIAKKLESDQLQKGFCVLAKSFQPLTGKVVDMQLTKMNPYPFL